jgi:hypothetical protein
MQRDFVFLGSYPFGHSAIPPQKRHLQASVPVLGSLQAPKQRMYEAADAAIHQQKSKQLRSERGLQVLHHIA